MSDGVPKVPLPNAPLVEVVFELRWKLQGSPDTPTALHADPGFIQLQEAFTAGAKKLGFAVQRNMVQLQNPILGNTVSRRFYTTPESAFPIFQIGSGIFATNQSSEYEWSSFKKQIRNGVRAVLESYPSLADFPLTPTHLELRYVDAFDKSLVGSADILHFLDRGTHMNIVLPEFLSDNTLFANGFSGRVSIQRDLRKIKSSKFIFDLASGSREGTEIIRLETKIITQSEGVPKLRNPATFLSDLDKWLDFSHDIASPFFKEFVTSDLMRTFERSI